MIRRFTLFGFLAFAAVVSCGTPPAPPPKPPPAPEPPTPDPDPPRPDPDGLGTPIGDACANLRVIRCPEGAPRAVEGGLRTCYETTRFTVQEMGVGFPTICIIAARTAVEVRACGNGTRELRVRCMGAP